MKGICLFIDANIFVRKGASQKRSENSKRHLDLGALYTILTKDNKLWGHDQRKRRLAPRSTFTKGNLVLLLARKR